MTLMQRYEAGETVAVWAELVEGDGDVRHGELAEQAQAVTAALMERVQQNLHTLERLLKEDGYQFSAKHPLLTPSPETEQMIASFQEEVGPLPLALAAFYRQVGGVDFRGEQPRWLSPGAIVAESPRQGLLDESRFYGDPVMVPTLFDLYRECKDRSDELAELEPDEGLLVTFSPDYFAKEEGEGGLYGILLPDPGADTDLELDEPDCFVDYLRRAMAFGGFPGWAHYLSPPLDELRQLHTALQPF